LAARCPDGQVVATDIDTSFLSGCPRQIGGVLRHDVVDEVFSA
jgi:hypothetical protein